MAEEVQIRGTQEIAKIRNPLAPALLPFVTFGIYYLVWYFKINKEMAELGKATGRTEELGDSPGTSLMAVMFGWIIIVPPILSFYNTCKRQQALRNMTTPGDNGLEPGLGLILGLFIGPVATYMIQDSLNKGWSAQAGGAGAVGPGAAAGIPAQQPQQPVQ
jgi:Domain of unknown function (DUF4234)